MEYLLSSYHIPVLMEETVRLLDPQSGDQMIDGTLGGGGHAEALLQKSAPDGLLLGIDRDPQALEEAANRLARFGDRVILRKGNFSDLADIAEREGFGSANGVLLDLGVSSHQLDDPQRGFSFRSEGPLDMRMDPESYLPLKDILATMDKETITRILREYGEVPNAGRIAGELVKNRDDILTTSDLAKIVEAAIPYSMRKKRTHLHPATLVFQALRIFINKEMESLESLLASLPAPLAPNGRVAIISYHSLEDRRVKTRLKALSLKCICPPSMPICGCPQKPAMEMVTRKAIKASEQEVASNPRARSARLRVARRLEEPQVQTGDKA